MVSGLGGPFHRGVASTIGQLQGDGRGRLFLVLTVGWLFAIGTRVVFPALLPEVRAALAFDLTTAGLVLTAPWIAYALSQFPGGVLGDRFGERAILVASAAVATGGSCWQRSRPTSVPSSRGPWCSASAPVSTQRPG
jgi:MFS family permease